MSENIGVILVKNGSNTVPQQCAKGCWIINEQHVCGSLCVLPGRERGDELPLLGPADAGRWDTTDLTWQNGVFTLNH